jgi:hypothetical protein
LPPPRHQQHRYSGVLAIPENRREGRIIGVFRVVGATALDDDALETLVLKNAADLDAGRAHIGGVDAGIADEAIRMTGDQLGYRGVADLSQPPARQSTRDDAKRYAGSGHLGKALRQRVRDIGRAGSKPISRIMPIMRGLSQ